MGRMRTVSCAWKSLQYKVPSGPWLKKPSFIQHLPLDTSRHSHFNSTPLNSSPSSNTTIVTHLNTMCLHIAIDKIAVPCMFDAEGITTMPVSALFWAISLVVHQILLTPTGPRPSLPVLPRARRYCVGDSGQVLSTVWYTCQLMRSW